ncbi:MAG: phosphoenolpyruvate synthase, partial [Candidatus Aenigmatarchaeota archaeon]
MSENLVWFNQIGMGDVSLVGGKTASLGEMIRNVKVPVPNGFAITSHAYRSFMESSGLMDKIRRILEELDVDDVRDLRRRGKKIRNMIVNAEFPDDLKKEIVRAYERLGEGYVAVRSSATAEDLPDASFAGQQETYLNVRGKKNLLEAVKKCMASLFTDRAIHYRVDKGFDHFKVYLSVAVQRMVNSQAAGVMFTLDPDSGFRDVIFINGSYGLGELVVQGEVTPDEFLYFKPTGAIISKKLGDKSKKLVRSGKGNVIKNVSKKDRERYVLTDREVRKLSEYGLRIEKHYGRPMDIEWAKDQDGKLYILQARPETVHSVTKRNIVKEYVLKEKSKVLLTGKSVGRKIGAGKVNVIMDAKEIHKFKKGEVLVTDMTDPDWEPIMRIASAIITDKGGSTSHAAIVSRELGIPAVIGTNIATRTLKTGQKVTVDCTGDEGRVWSGILKYSIREHDIGKLPKTKTKIFMNVGVPENAFDQSRLPVDGVGLARQEFIIGSHIGEHPLAMIESGREEEYIEKLAYGIARIAAAFYPREVIVRLSDFKTNEYANLKGGEKFEPLENNPMIGWRGASRYISKDFEPAFRLECRALKRVRDEFGLTNVKIMIPFCRTIDEAKRTIKIMESEGLKRGKNGLELYVMAEIPSNIILADEFSKLFDGFSIGSNDLTQLTLGVDRDNQNLSKIFDERNEAVKRMIRMLIKEA